MTLDSNSPLIGETCGGFEVGVTLDSNSSLIHETGGEFEVWVTLDSNSPVIDETCGGFEVGVTLDSNSPLIDETGGGFEIGVNNTTAVEERHSSGDIYSERQLELQVEVELFILEYIGQRTLPAELIHCEVLALVTRQSIKPEHIVVDVSVLEQRQRPTQIFLHVRGG